VNVGELAHVLPGQWIGRNEAELVNELQCGSEEAFDWLVTHYHGQVYALLYGMLGDSSDAADSTQEVFLKAFRGIRAFRCGSSLKTWLYRIAVREALNSKRWRWRHMRNQVSLDAEREEEHNFAEPADKSESPFDRMAARELHDAVQGALQRVPEVYRSAVILRDLEGLDYDEIAEVLEISIGTVKSRILRGRQWLREILEPLIEPAAQMRAGERAEIRARRSSAAGRVFGWIKGRKLAGFAGGVPYRAVRDGGGE
jgi:RNA polymerase sigma-70 factor (ECF subfamily)